MYIIIDKKTNQCYVYKYTKDVISLIKCSRSTILRNKCLEYWSYNEWIIYNPVEVKIKASRRGKSL